jgi:hypothetical protein
MPRAPRRGYPSPDERQAALPLAAARRTAPTPEQTAKASVAKRYKRTPAGNLIVPLTPYLAPEVVERLTARALRKGSHSFAAWVTEVLEREGKRG